jgi:tRNA nucleotidyltransferase (CCA-adding enzyme)
MAYNDKDGLIDPFNGQKDLENKIIRCVGKAEDRFNEDALRMLRAIRFACQLDFEIHPSIGWQIGYTDMINKLNNISVERINSEFVKIVMTKQFHKRLVWNKGVFLSFIPELKDMIYFKQNNPYHIYDVFLHTVHALEKCNSDDLIVRLAVLFHDIGKPHCKTTDENGIDHFKGHGKVSAEITDNIMKRLRFDNETRNNVVELIHYHDATFEVGKKYIKRWLNKIGEVQFRRLLEVRKADIKAQNPVYEKERLKKVRYIENILEEVLKENECFSLKDLAVNGNDVQTVMQLKEGKDIGYWLNEILNRVIDGELNNNKDDLIHWMTGVADGWIKV